MSDEERMDSLPGHGDNAFADEKQSATRTKSEGAFTTESLDASSDSVTSREVITERRLFRDGQLILMPAPTQDPRDPLNLPLSRKIIAVTCISLFGGLAASAELILGAMLPVFVLEYAGINPKVLVPLTYEGGLPLHSDPLKYLGDFPNIPPIWKIYLLASIPILVIGLANMIFVPLAIAIGRRSVLIGSASVAIAGAVWAGHSTSLESHIAARAVQAIGAGTIESLIPFIIQDMVFVHQRNTWIAGAFTAQGALIVGLGVSCTWIIYYLSWRWMYFITASAAGVFLVGIIIFLPETRWDRTPSEMDGIPRDETQFKIGKRSVRYDLALWHGQREWKKGLSAFTDTATTFFYPHIFLITMLDSSMIAAALAAGYTASPALITAPWTWPFFHLGLCLIPVLIGAIFVFVITGLSADWVANYLAKITGDRKPENQLANLALPTICALIGSILFGVSGDNQNIYPWEVFLLSLGLMTFGFLGANSIGAVYVLECYPHMTGSALMNIAAIRCLLAFLFSFKVSEWVSNLGYENTFLIFIGLQGFFALTMPFVWYYGPAWRKRWPGRGEKRATA